MNVLIGHSCAFDGLHCGIGIRKIIKFNGFSYDINYGIKTGYNAAFIIDNETKEALIAEDPRSAEIIKPMLRGRDIKRYRAEWAGLWLIATFPTLKININNYPSVKKHLLLFGREKLEQSGKILFDGIKARKKTKHAWYELQDTCAYHGEFANNKLIWRRVAKQGMFAYQENEIYCINAGCIITGKYLKYICAILNTKINAWYSQHLFPTSGTGTFHWEIVHVERLLIPKINHYDQLKFVTLLDNILKSKNLDPNICILNQEKQIDRLIYNIYNLNDKEITIIEEYF